MTSFTHTPAGDDDEFDRLLDQSSVGTPEARAVSHAVTPERVDELVRRLAEDKGDFDEELVEVVIADLDDEFVDNDVTDLEDEFVYVTDLDEEFIDVIELNALPVAEQLLFDGAVGDLDGIWSIAADGVVTTRKAWSDRVQRGGECVEEPIRASFDEGLPYASTQIAPPLPVDVAQAAAAVGAATEQQVLAHVVDEDRREVARLAERVRRHAMDRHLFEVIQAEGFAGRRWERLIEDLARYGAAVTGSWMRSGRVIVELGATGVPSVGFSWFQLRELSCDKGFRDELSARTVSKALTAFRVATVAGVGWDHDGGAGLSTFIISRCVHAFEGEFQRCSHWRELFTHRLDELREECTTAVSTDATVFVPLPAADEAEVLWWEVLGNLAMVIEDVTDVPATRVGPQLRFVEDLGMDSIHAVEVGVHIEEIYDVRVPSVLLPAMHTVADAVDFIAAQCHPAGGRPAGLPSVGSPPPTASHPSTSLKRSGLAGGN